MCPIEPFKIDFDKLVLLTLVGLAVYFILK